VARDFDFARLVDGLRAAGCVFAEEEAAILVAAGRDGDHLDELLSRRLAGEPLEHIVGTVSFGELTLLVGAGQFVPRQRSVQLASLAISECLRRPGAVMLELCCGVAPIAASVEHAHAAEMVVASDHDEDSLSYARRNLRTAHVYAGDMFDALPSAFQHCFDVIAVVPPYVPAGEAHLLSREARHHEPPQALFGGPDGLAVVRRILGGADEWLTDRGTLLMELHRTQTAAAVELAGEAGLVAGYELAADGHTCLLHNVRH
jgi:release factor glutamine methyltransferase